MPKPTEKSISSIVAALTDEADPKTYSETDSGERVFVDSADRKAKVWKLFISGASAEMIATVCKVSPSTVYRDLDEIRTAYREQIEQKTGLGLIAEHLQFLDEIEKTAYFDAMQSSAREIDARTGVVEKVKNSPEKARLLSVVLKAREMKIKLMIETGVIPKEPERLHHSFEKTNAKKEDKVQENRTNDDILVDIAELLSKIKPV